MEDSGALPIEVDVTKMAMGDVIEVYPYEGVVKAHGSGEAHGSGLPPLPSCATSQLGN